MFRNYCCCCYKIDKVLLPINTKSSHDDGKRLLDYFNCIFGAFVKERDALDFICARCSKALQVSYHFVNMVKESEERNNEMIFDNSPFNGMRHSIQHEQNTKNNFKVESHLYCQTNMSDMPLNQVVPLNNFKIFDGDPNTDAGSCVQDKIYKESDLMCNICNKLFESKQIFFEHNRLKHKEIVPYKCELCSFYTCYTESLLKHRKKYHGSNNGDVDLHQAEKGHKLDGGSLDFEITYLCIPCKFKGYSQTDIDEHLLKVHSIEEDKDSLVTKHFECPLCYRSFMTLKSVKIHYSMSHNFKCKNANTCSNRKFDCEKCGKIFDLKSGLLLHRRICEKRNAVKCNFCKLYFTSVLKYERHLQDTHSVIIKHECEICGKTFNCSEYLTVHRKRHNERYYQCDLCPKNYISNADLKVHKQRIHVIKHVGAAGSFCGKTFTTEKKAQGKKFFKCECCDYTSH